MGGHCRRHRVHRRGHLLHRVPAGHGQWSRRLRPPPSPQAARDDASSGRARRYGPGCSSGRCSRRARPAAVLVSAGHDTCPIETHTHARCSLEHRAYQFRAVGPERFAVVSGRSKIRTMSETPAPAPPPPPAATPPPPLPPEKLPRLYQAAAWVVIVAGVIFIAWTLFLAGAVAFGQGRCYHHRHHHHDMYWPGGPGGPDGPGPWPGWQFGFPGQPPPGMGPGFPSGPGGPGGPAASTTGPGTPQTPSTPGPTTAPARP